MKHHFEKGLRRKAIGVAVAMAMPMLALGGNAYAACTAGSAPATDANSVTCTEGSTYTNASGTTVSNTATISAGNPATSVVRMTGNGNTFNNAGTLSNDSTYTNTGANAGAKYGALIGATDVAATSEEPNVMTNSGSISATITDANMLTNKARLNTAAAVGLGTDAEGEYALTNSGSISATHNGVGRVNGVEAGGDVEEMIIVNSGTITGTQSHAITKTTSTATSFQGRVTLSDASTTTAANIGVAAGIYAEEEVFGLEIENSGTIAGVGTYASGIYTRAVESAITNTGTISGTKIGIAQVSDGGEIRSMALDNSGTINGDILSVNGSALRWWSLSNGEGTGGATLDSRLSINSQTGQADSAITNSGTVNGDLYFSNGTHVLTNTAEGTLNGDIDLDQRDTFGSIVGTKLFSFENAGNFTGDLTIRTASSGGVTSDITLIPTVTHSGAGSSLASPSSNIAGMGGTLNVITTAGGSEANITLAPKVGAGAVVKDGEFFTVASDYQINSVTVAGGAATLPNVTSANSLISWEVAVNNSGNLVLESEVSTAGITGLSGNASSALNALLGFDSELGSLVQNLPSNEDVQQAAEQIRPEINNAGYQAMAALTDRVSGVIGMHLDNTHVGSGSGVSTGDQPAGVGVWVQGFGFDGEQDRRKGVDGYDADAFGFVVGADTLIGNGATRVGAAVSYGNSNVDAHGVNQGNNLDIDSYQATLYGSMLMQDWYLNASLAIARHEVDSERIVLGNKVKGSFDNWQYSGRLEAGKPYNVGKVTLTPVASLAYSYLDQDSYTEHGTGALHISGENTDSLRSGLGAKVLIPLATQGVDAGLELRAIWNHEFADTEQDTTARFAAGGGTFHTSGVDVDRDSANIGASLRISGGDKLVKQSLLVSYDAEIRDEYVGQTAVLQARFDF